MIVLHRKRRLLFIANVDWFFISHRLPVALGAIEDGYEVHFAGLITGREKFLTDQGIVVHKLDIARSAFGVLNITLVILQIYRLIKLISPDIVHLVTIKPVILGGIVCKLIGVPALVVAISGLGHVFTANNFLSRLRRFVVQYLYKFVLSHKNCVVIFQNESDIDTLVRATNLPAGKLRLIHGSGVSLSEYCVESIPTSETVIMLASRLISDKGIWEFVEAARIIGRRDIKFVLVGDIDDSNPNSLTRHDIRKITEEGHVEYWGFRSDMASLLKSCYMVVLPSYYGEGLPKILIEAAASGRAIVTTDNPGCRDAIIDGETGILVPVRDAKLLASAIESLINDGEKCKTMGLLGRELAEDRYDIRDVVAKHLGIYADVIH